MSTDTGREFEMSSWQAYRFHRNRIGFAVALAAFGFVLVMAPMLLESDAFATAYAMAYGSAFAFYGALLVFAFAYDGRARRLVDWLLGKFGDQNYPWPAHDVEVTYRDE